MKGLSWAKAREWLPVAFLAVVLVYALVASILITGRIARVDQFLVAQERADRQTILSHEALLKRVEADEHRICVAAKATGDQPIIKILCPSSP